MIGVVVLVAGGLVWYQKQEAGRLTAESERRIAVEKARRDQEEKGRFDAARVVAEYGGSTVYIETSWKLVETRSKKTVYQSFAEVKTPKGKENVPLYIQLPNGVECPGRASPCIEPLLVLDDPGGRNQVVGGRHSGSGFVVTDNGFILTNRHVAAAWQTSMGRFLLRMPGILVKVDRNFKEQSREVIQDIGAVADWVPTRSVQAGRWDPKNLIGESQYLDVTFAKSKTRTPARVVKISDEADAAMIKIDTPKALTPVALAPTGSYEEVKPGDPVIVLGYPGISPKVFVRTESQDPFARAPSIVEVPDNTVSVGAIGRLIRGSQKPAGGAKSDYFSSVGDMYQLTINSTGPGNSGGPTFDAKGHVIAIFAAGTAGGGGVSYAIPIKYGLELLDIKPVIR